MIHFKHPKHVYGHYGTRTTLLPGEPTPIGAPGELDATKCRFMFGEPWNGWCCCGHPKRKNSSWCHFHHDVVFISPSKRVR